jgi:hypothetical protein
MKIKRIVIMMWFFTWLILSILVAVFAGNRGKSSVLYFFISIILSPLLGFLIVLVTGDDTKKKCNNCGQNIDKSAKVCPFCLDGKKTIEDKVNPTIKKENKIIKINDSTSKLILEKSLTPYTLDDLKRIIIKNYDEKYRPTASIDSKDIFFFKSTAGEYQSNHIQIQIKDEEYIIEGFNVPIPNELEIVNIKRDKEQSVNNVDRLIELGKLYKDGILTKEEFEEQKGKLK